MTAATFLRRKRSGSSTLPSAVISQTMTAPSSHPVRSVIRSPPMASSTTTTREISVEKIPIPPINTGA
ncbi:hypothetical protein [Microbacterium maritypicum]